MSEPTGGGWASPGQRPTPTPGPASTPAPPPAAPAQPATDPAQQPPGWTAQPGWGGEAPGSGPQSGPQYGPPGQPGAQPAWGGGGWGSGLPQAPRPGVVPLRPLGLGELLDGAVGLVRGYPRATLGVSAVIALATTLVQLALLLTVLRPLFDVDTVALEAGDPEELVGLLAGAVGAGSLAVLFGTVTGALMTGFLSAVAGRAVLGEPMSLGELWAGTKGKLGRLVGGALLFTLLVYGPLLLAGLLAGGLTAALGGAGAAVGVLLALAAVVLTVVSYVRFSLAPAAVVLEDVPVTTSLRRSWRLVRRSTWRVLGVLLLALVVGSIVGQLLQLPFALFAGDGGPLAALSGEAAQSLTTRAVVLSAIGTGVASTLVAPFTAGVTALLYVDRRMRAEGLDVALQAAAADRR